LKDRIENIVEKARTSTFHLWLLNFFLPRVIPFNKAHHFQIKELGTNNIVVLLPYRKSNLNHLKGLHACALATASEMACGFLLISRLGMKNYRLILKSLEMKYLYQGKMNAFAKYQLDESYLNKMVIAPLETQDQVEIQCQVYIEDLSGNKLTEALATWQIKKWSSTKTHM